MNNSDILDILFSYKSNPSSLCAQNLNKNLNKKEVCYMLEYLSKSGRLTVIELTDTIENYFYL